MVFLSSDYVFDGRSGPFDEGASTSPLNVYGRLKLAAEGAVQRISPRALIVRTTNVYGFDPRSMNYMMRVLATLRRGEPVTVAVDQRGTPTFVDDLCGIIRDLILAGVTGIVHVAGPEWMNRVTWARALAVEWGFDPLLVRGAPTSKLRQAARRPLAAGLRSRRLGPTRPLAEGLVRMRVDEALAVRGSTSPASLGTQQRTNVPCRHARRGPDGGEDDTSHEDAPSQSDFGSRQRLQLCEPRKVRAVSPVDE
jgi:dTDP-4-dehydrorhamnose reductase